MVEVTTFGPAIIMPRNMTLKLSIFNDFIEGMMSRGVDQVSSVSVHVSEATVAIHTRIVVDDQFTGVACYIPLTDPSWVAWSQGCHAGDELMRFKAKHAVAKCFNEDV